MIQTIALVALMFSRSSVMSQASELVELREKNMGSMYDKRAITDKYLEKLFSIKDSQGWYKQPTSNLDELYVVSDNARKELYAVLNEITDKYDANYLSAPVKTRERAEQKIAHQFNGDVSLITDIVRDSIVADSIKDVVDIYDYLSNRVEIVRVKNRFNSPTKSGYRDLSTTIRLPNTGILAEVQIHLREISKVKSGSEHDVYEIIQGLERNAKLENRALSKFEISQIESAREQSRNLYHQAWILYSNSPESNMNRIS